jgi:peptidoglycan LD-endopeptidase LytH
LGVLKQVRRRRIAAVAVVTVLSVPAGATAAPASPLQEDASEDNHEAGTEHAVIEIDVDVAEASPSEIAGAASDVLANVTAQLEQLRTAEAAVTSAINVLADKSAAVSDTELRVEELTVLMDEVVVEAFVTPPQMGALEVLDAESAEDATVTQMMLDMQADEHADVLAEHEEARRLLEEQMEEQEAAAANAEAARADAEAALADLEAAVDQQTQFILAVHERLDDPAAAANPTLQAQSEALAAQLREIEEAEAAAEAQAALQEARRRASADIGWIVCPVESNYNFVDTWGAARGGGRTHKGTDIMAPRGTPTLAPVSGEVVHRSTSLGGLSWYVYGANGDEYYGTHLDGYENQGAGYVEAGTVIGYVGTTGNAPEGSPHLHFEQHPGGGSPINPYPLLDASCPGH